MVELFRIGHFAIYLFGVTIVLGILAGLFIMIKEAKRKGLNVDKMTDLALYTVITSIIGARLYYVFAFNPGYYLNNPKEIIALRDGGLSIQGALIFGIIFAIWYTKKKNISFGKAADAFAPGIIMGQAIGRIGCDVFGVPMTRAYFWGININNQLLHPAQLYEAIFDLMLFTYLWKSRGNTKYDGQLFIKYIIGFSIIRGIVEFFRINPIVIGPFTIAHVTSVGIIIGSIIINSILKKRNNVENIREENEVAITSPVQYFAILLIGVVGILVYYFVH